MKRILGSVELNGLEFFAFHGLYDFERNQGNQFTLNISVQKYYSDEELTDESKFLDYEKIYAVTEEEMNIPTRLLETVAANILKRIEALFAENISRGEIASIKIEIQKASPPIKDARVKYSAFKIEKNF